MKFPCVISKGKFHIKQKGNFILEQFKNKFIAKLSFEQECIRGCVPPARYRTGWSLTGGVFVQGGSLSRRVFVRGSLSRRCVCPGGVSVRETPLWKEWQTDKQAGRCKNITFPQLRLRGAKTHWKTKRNSSQLLHNYWYVQRTSFH